jgi:aryl-alcohol dehydrogenase-like predicted oxidoreductase
MLQVPGAVLDGMKESRLRETIQERGIAVFVRQILNHQMGGRPSSVDGALRAVLTHNVVTSMIVGISRQAHLAMALEAVR